MHGHRNVKLCWSCHRIVSYFFSCNMYPKKFIILNNMQMWTMGKLSFCVYKKFFPCKFNIFQTTGLTRVNYSMIYGFHSVIVKDGGLLVTSSKTLL